MEEFSNVKKNSFFYLISTTSRLVSNAILFIIVARYYGAEIYGSFTVAHTLSSFALVIADFGFDLLIISEIAQHPQKTEEIFLKYLPLKIMFCFIAFGLLLLSTIFIPTSELTLKLILIFAFNMFFTALTNNFFAFFRGLEKFFIEAKVSFITNILILALVWFGSLHSISVILIALIILFARIIGFILIGKEYLSLYSFRKFEKNFNLRKEEFKKSLVFGLHLLFGTLYFQIDTILLVALKNEYEAGIYQAVFKLLVIVLVVPELIIGALFPTVARLFSSGEDSWNSSVRFAFKLLFLICLPICLIMYFYPAAIIKIIYAHKEYMPAIEILQISAFVIFIRFIAEPFAMTLTATKKQTTRTIIVFIATVVNVVLNVFLIPIWGAKGAIIVSVVTNLFTFIAYFVFAPNRSLNIMLNPRLIITSVISIMVGLLLLNILKLTIYFYIPIFLLFYMVFVFAFILTKKEKEFIFSFKGLGL